MVCSIQCQTTYTIIDGNSESTYSGPIYGYYQLGIHQNLYLSSEIGSSGTISKLQWEWDGSSQEAKTVQIYMGNTSKTSFSDANDYVPGSELTKVFDGEINYSGASWYEITLDTPFEYTGNSLVIFTDNNDGDYTNGSSRRFKSLSTGVNRSLYYYSSIYDYSVTDQYYSGTEDNVPSLKLTITAPSCLSPSNLSTSSVTSNSADINWTASSSAPANGYEYFYSTSSTEPTSGTSASGGVGAGITTANISGLSATTQYYYWVRANCGIGDLSYWASGGTFTTSCATSSMPYSEGFNDTSIPSCWSSEIVSGSGTYLSYETSGSNPTTSPQESTHMVQYNSFSASSGHQERIMSGPISSTGMSNVTFEFYYRHDQSAYTTSSYDTEGIQPQYSINGGSSWTDVGSFIKRTAADGWTQYSLNLPSGADNQPDLRIAFVFVSAYGNRQFIDNISLTATSSAPPTVSSFTPSSLCEGATITITGTNFSGASAVSIGGTAVSSYVVNSTTEISAVVGSGTTGTISVETSTGTGSSSGSVTVNANPSAVSVTGGGIICENATLSATGGSGGTIYWQGTNSGGTSTSGGSGANSPAITTTGTYYARAESNGCWGDEGSAVVTDLSNSPTGVSASASASEVCSGGTVSLTGSASSDNKIKTNSSAGALIDLTTLERTIEVSGTNSNANELISLTLNLTHTWVEDLDITLQAPNGSVIVLSSDNGGSSDNYTNTVFSTSGTAITSGTAPFTGTFTPEESFSNLTGSADGTWTLSIYDDESIAEGEFIDFTIELPNTISYSWSSSVGGFTSGVQNPTSNSITENTTYTVTATVASCSSTATTSVTSTSAPVITSSSTVTDVTTCGVTSIDISVDTDGATGTWADGSNGLFVIGETETTNTYATNTYNSNLTLTWTNNSGACSGSTATITAKFNQPSPTGSMDSDSWVWGGLTNSTWTTGSNWYRWESSKWVKQQVAYPDAGSKIYVLPTSDVCVSSTLNNAATSITDLNIESGGSFDLGSVNTSITGNITNDGTMQGGTGTVTLSGSTDQTISGSGTVSFNNLTVNKSSGSAIISTQTDIRNTLTMTKGNIVNSQPVVIGVNSSSPGTLSHASGIVTGELRRYFANATGSTFFPVGTSSNMRDVTINFTQAPGTDEYLTVSYVAGAPVLSGADGDYSGLPLITNDDQLIQNYSADGHWNIDPTGGNYESTEINSAAYEITLHCKALTVQPTDVSKVRIIKSAGSETPILNHVSWTGLDLLSYSGDGSDFTITAAATGFSKFGAGSDDGNALPVELVSFSGACNDGVVELIWETASEYNSSHFDVENSRDGITWDVVKTIEAAGFSNELITYGYKDFHSNSGDNYYRLTQADLDGTSKTYDIINVSCSQTAAGYFSIFPNPSSGSFQVMLNNSDIVGSAEMNIVDTKGNKVMMKSIDVKTGINMFAIDENLAPGIYYISVLNGNYSTIVLKHSVK